jgi:tripartite-type tricarboxylate transporter receptor subunit TctC
LTTALGKSFVIDNRGGGGGNIGSAAVTRAKADGQTMLITSSAPIVINPSLYKKMAFNPATDLIPVTNLLRAPLVLVAHPSVPAKNVKELLALIKSKNGQFSYASAGNGTPQHLTGEIFRGVTKLDMVHVPYKGSAPAISDLLGGHIPIMFDSTIAIMPHIKSGKVKPIAISGNKRSPLLPDVPTFAEAGLPIESYAWYGMFVPAKTPKAVVDKINAETQKVMKSPDFQRVLADTGTEYVGDTPENFAKFVQAETTKWSKVVKDSGATVD